MLLVVLAGDLLNLNGCPIEVEPRQTAVCEGLLGLPSAGHLRQLTFVINRNIIQSSRRSSVTWHIFCFLIKNHLVRELLSVFGETSAFT